MINPCIYLLPLRGIRREDFRAVAELLRSSYQVLRSGLAPLGIGVLYQTATPVTDEHQQVLGLVPWE
ncbi:MAG: hypothetical protein A3H57_03615 [Candidatus Taylorbacteria bacterium RIFCSPLOWO2_02_FULL_43_11]|uniref:Uncharacterized protein n=1 Tax=Candidatus Taylorbacteria bacterium RIFCSPHIGHO2_02_FULL_43_32b TaxID=1802306 RepID=A0A1G2MNN5_9BACT|nr:MAG: hypothetical protein A2743_04555 [Candidatus Taylorbacteria bacterium RIFCSPHIGHO2_01_FULL_43_47]OHA24809.1 MAG: hypothetical protein A3C72_03180 [Candidatus Taylorbacteria bacterium RIFCSPHIGHO2_02_FULL_43_32b]OHA31850.1 MAG: hypothetical protein A3B08_01055 [Candidatus Taylorbacteria bacterium RIFCSPLOWO2_01_FULL_43_44]OHA35643.1 MAG: hypothetical protein A3H57_03615 [Candidatus Taylorbacteria bacterium RIFCSPLOWO2_02_FULL_43_11]